jgi:hypothetical protein
MIMLVGAAVTLIAGHPLGLFIAVLVCGGVFTLSTRAVRRPVVVHVREQLLARPECLHLWGSDPRRIELAGVLCRALARAKYWPNDHFIPDDPMELAFFEISGVDAHAEVVEVGMELTKKTGNKIDWNKLGSIAKLRPLTLGHLLDGSL